MLLRLLILLVFAGAAVAADRPNILLILADNWAYPHAGALGDATVKTPVFDRIAREGVLFTHTFCPVPSCSPTRSCILTGRTAHQLGAAASLWSAFPKQHRVVTDRMRESGYEVGFMGKGWAPGNYQDFGWTQNPVGRQFKSFDEFLAARAAGKPFFFWLGYVATVWRTSNLPGDVSSTTVRVPSLQLASALPSNCVASTPAPIGRPASTFPSSALMTIIIWGFRQPMKSRRCSRSIDMPTGEPPGAVDQ